MGGADATRAGAEPGARKPGKAWSGKCELGVQGNLKAGQPAAQGRSIWGVWVGNPSEQPINSIPIPATQPGPAPAATLCPTHPSG